MKLSEFQPAQKPAPPVSESPVSVEPEVASPQAPQEEQKVTAKTPSGVEIEYVWSPRRLYRLNRGDVWEEVPSVTTVLGVLDKSGPLTWWGMKVGIDGCIALHEEGHTLPLLGTEEIVRRLTERKLTVNHVKDKAADRGVSVHTVLEEWVASDTVTYDNLADNEQPYAVGLEQFFLAIEGAIDGKEAELMVGSLQHQYAGRFDLVLTLAKPVSVVTRVFPKKPPRIEEIPAGRYLLDLKTSKRVYDTHYLQLEAYEAAAVECGYAPTDYRGVVHVTADGRYELALNKDWCFDDFLAVRRCFAVMNERAVVQALRDELDAKEVSA